MLVKEITDNDVRLELLNRLIASDTMQSVPVLGWDYDG